MKELSFFHETIHLKAAYPQKCIAKKIFEKKSFFQKLSHLKNPDTRTEGGREGGTEVRNPIWTTESAEEFSGFKNETPQTRFL